MDKKLIASVFIATIAGLVGGYGLGYVIYQPQIQNLQNDMNALNDKFDTVDSALTNTQTSVASLEDELNTVSSEVQSLDSTVETMGNRTWHEVYSIDGSSDVTTGLFQLKGNSVRVSWWAMSTSLYEVSESSLEIWLCSSNGTLYAVWGSSGLFNSNNADVPLEKGGDYYLDINAYETSYIVAVWDYY